MTTATMESPLKYWIGYTRNERGAHVQNAGAHRSPKMAAVGLAYHGLAGPYEIWQAVPGSDGMLHVESPRLPQLWERSKTGVRRVA